MIEFHKIYNDCRTNEIEAVGYEVLICGELFETCDFQDLHDTLKRAEEYLHK